MGVRGAVYFSVFLKFEMSRLIHVSANYHPDTCLSVLASTRVLSTHGMIFTLFRSGDVSVLLLIWSYETKD